MANRVDPGVSDERLAVEDAYKHMSALCNLLSMAGDAPLPASHVHQLLKPVIISLDKATEDF